MSSEQMVMSALEGKLQLVAGGVVSGSPGRVAQPSHRSDFAENFKSYSYYSPHIIDLYHMLPKTIYIIDAAHIVSTLSETWEQESR